MSERKKGNTQGPKWLWLLTLVPLAFLLPCLWQVRTQALEQCAELEQHESLQLVLKQKAHERTQLLRQWLEEKHEDVRLKLEGLSGEDDAQEWMLVQAEQTVLKQMEAQIQRWLELVQKQEQMQTVAGVFRASLAIGMLWVGCLFMRRIARQWLHVHQNSQPLSRLSRWLPENAREGWLGDYYEVRGQWHQEGRSPLSIRRDTLGWALLLVLAGIRYRIYDAIFAHKTEGS